VGKCGVLLLEDLEALHVVSFFCGHPNLAEKLSLALLFKRLVVLIIKLRIIYLLVLVALEMLKRAGVLNRA
jgi:hypothetical protein